jgi:hypothetical protein
MPCLAFCANCGSDRLQIAAVTAKGLEVTCYTCTKRSVLDGVILGEVDFLAGAKSKVDTMLGRAREHAAKVAKRPFVLKAKT